MNYPDGIYFHMPMETYLKLPRLGSSSIKDLLISETTFWRNSWMNPDREDNDTPARQAGRAYHTARLEPDAFEARYARGFDKSEYPEALATDAAVKAALKDLDQTQTLKGENAEERAQRLIFTDGFYGSIASLIEADIVADAGDREILPPDMYDRALSASAFLRSDAEIEAFLVGGAAEVVVLWTRPDGEQMKARFDYLRGDLWLDLKSFSNPNGKSVDMCVTHSIQYNSYYIQMALYQEAAEVIRVQHLQVNDARPGDREIIDAIRERTEPIKCVYLFVETQDPPTVALRHVKMYAEDYQAPDEMPETRVTLARHKSRLHERGATAVNYACRLYRQAEQVYGSSPWWWSRTNGRIDDLDFSPYWLDGESL